MEIVVGTLHGLTDAIEAIHMHLGRIGKRALEGVIIVVERLLAINRLAPAQHEPLAI